jgi:hypothetical protein
VYFKNHRALSVTALSATSKNPKLKQGDYTPERVRLTVDFSSADARDVRRVDSHAAILGPQLVSSLPDLHARHIG